MCIGTVGLGNPVGLGAGEAVLTHTMGCNGGSSWDAGGRIHPVTHVQGGICPLCMPCHAIQLRTLIVTSLTPPWSNVIILRAVVVPGKAMCRSWLSFYTVPYHSCSWCWESLRQKGILLPIRSLVLISTLFQKQSPLLPTIHTGRWFPIRAEPNGTKCSIWGKYLISV